MINLNSKAIIHTIICALQLLCSYICTQSHAVAEDIVTNNQPKQFYKKDFVHGQSPLLDENDEGNKEQITHRQVGTTGPKPIAEPLATITSLAPPSRENVTRSYRLRSIGAIISATPIDHLKTYYTKLLEIALKHDISISAIYTPNPDSNFGKIYSSKTDFYLWLMGGHIEPSKQAPKGLEKVKLSPTWLLDTEAGLIILEGIGNLENFIDSEGNYREPIAY